MIKKRIICPERMRRVPKRFSWVDQRLVRDGHIRKCSPEGLSLYLFLVIVGDRFGLSYYSDRAVSDALSIDEKRVLEARRELISSELIAFRKPIYQVLSLEKRREKSSPELISTILSQALTRKNDRL